MVVPPLRSNLPPTLTQSISTPKQFAKDTLTSISTPVPKAMPPPPQPVSASKQPPRDDQNSVSPQAAKPIPKTEPVRRLSITGDENVAPTKPDQALQPKVEDATEDAVPTPTPAKAHVQKDEGTLEVPLSPRKQAPPESASEATPKSVVPPPSQRDIQAENASEAGSKSMASAPQQKDIQSETTSQVTMKTVVPRRSLEDSLSTLATKHSRSATPATSPPQTPRLNYYSGGPPGPVDYMGPMSPNGMPYPYAYPPHMPMMQGGGPMYNGHYWNTPYSPRAEHRQLSDHGGQGHIRPGIEDDREHLLQKVSSVLPDLSRLLDEYKQTHGQLSAKEMLSRRSESEHAEQLNRVKIELDANKKEYEKVIQDLVGDRGRFEREVTELREKVTSFERTTVECDHLRNQVTSLQNARKELADSVDAIRLSKEEFLTSKLALDREIGYLKSSLQADKELHHQRMADVKKQHRDILIAKERDHDKAMSEQKATLSKIQLELAGLISKHAAQKKDLESSRSLENEHKGNLDVKGKELADALALRQQESETLKKLHAEECDKIKGESEEYAAKFAEEHANKEKEWQQSLETLRAEMLDQKEEFRKEREAHEIMRKGVEEEKKRAADLAGIITSWRVKTTELHKENENLDRILQGLGYATEMKSKGDQFL